MSSVTIQLSTIDTDLLENYPTSNDGLNTVWGVSPTTASRRRGILRFDFSAMVPAGATITLATLKLCCCGTLASRTLTVYRLLHTDWVETEATWNVYKAGSNWGTAGALGSGVDFTPTDAAAATSVPVNNWVNVTVTAQVQTAFSSVGGVAHFLVADEGASSYGANYFYSREPPAGNAALRPTLYIEYIDPAHPAPTFTPGLTITQISERCTATLTVVNAASLPSVIIIVDGKAYTGIWIPGTLYTFTYDIALERGPHIIYTQATDTIGTVTTAPIVYVMAYELSDYGIDIYSGDAQLDAIEPVLHDALLPDLPTLNFSCATLLTGNIQAVIRERGLRQYQFTIATVGASNGLYQYTCKAAESYALTTAIMALQTAYGSTANAIALLVPSLNIINASFLAQTTYPQLYANIQPLEVIKQLMIQALAQASVRNGNMYVFPLDVSAQVPDYHMQRLDPLTGWQRDADTFDAVETHYIVRQYPTPDTVLTLHDAANWTGTVTDVTQVATTLLPVPSGALGMLKSVGNASRAGLSALFKNYDRIRFNWNPVTAAYVDVSLQQDGANKLDLRHYFAGASGAGFLLNTGAASTDTLTKDIALSPVQFVTTVTGTVTAGCSYRVTLLDASNAILWQDVWGGSIGSNNTFSAHVPTGVSQAYQATTVRIEFTGLYLVDGVHYGVQAVTCAITVQTYDNVGSHERVVSSTQYYVNVGSHVRVVSSVTYSVCLTYPEIAHYFGAFEVAALTGSQWYQVSTLPNLTVTIVANRINLVDSGDYWGGFDSGPMYVPATISILETVQDYEWQTVVITETVQDYVWVPSTSIGSLSYFNLFESVDIALSAMTRTGNPTNLATIALTFTGDNYIDTLVMVADNPLPVTVRAGTGQRAYPVTDDFGSEAGAQAYADGLLPIVSVAREQYTRDVPLSTDLGVGDTVNCDGVPMTVYAADYRQDGKTLAAGKAMDTLMTRLAEQARRLGTLERKA